MSEREDNSRSLIQHGLQRPHSRSSYPEIGMKLMNLSRIIIYHCIRRLTSNHNARCSGCSGALRSLASTKVVGIWVYKLSARGACRYCGQCGPFDMGVSHVASGGEMQPQPHLTSHRTIPPAKTEVSQSHPIDR